MRSCKGLTYIALLLGMIAMVVSCTTDVDFSMGEEFVPSNQNMELRRRVYACGNSADEHIYDCALATTRLYKSDSLLLSNIGKGYFGYEKSGTFGSRKAGFMSQMIFSLSLPEERGWGYQPIFDSMVLSLCITDYHGDTLNSRRYNVYEITSNAYLTKSADTSFYAGFDPKEYISETPIFTFQFPNQARGSYVGDITNPQNSSVLLESTGVATEDYVKRLMLCTDLDDKGGYALDTDSIYVNGNELEFLERVRGIYIAPAEGEENEGAMFATDLSNTAMLLFARGRYEEDPAIIRDTTYMIYNMYLDPTQYTDLAAGNVSVNSIEHDYTPVINQCLDEALECDVCYVEGLGGVVTELCFADEFIQSIADIVLEAGADATVSINQAMFTIYLEGSNYDYNNLPASLTPLMNDAMLRMGMYVDYNNMTAISDYNYSVESSIALSYDGYLNRSLGCYQMDISTYIQTLMLVASTNVDSDGNVELDKFKVGASGEESGDYVNLRRIYIAPDASSLYGMKRQALYGMGGDAPVKLELTYTIVK